MSGARVGLDARQTRQLSAGMKAYVRELVARLPRVAPQYEYVPFTLGSNFGWDEQIGLPRAMKRAHLDLAHFLALYVPVVVPVRFVVTIHDLIHLRFPHHFKAKVRPYYETVVRWTCARAARVITDDERTVEDLVELLGVKREKIRVIPLGVSEAFFEPAAAFAGPRPYVLYVGNHRRHKDLDTLFEAWSALPPGLDVDLYVTGDDDFGGELQRRGAPNRSIVALGDVSEERLASYYAGARALVSPSLREGFGLPVLEAMAAGCPVIACADSVPRVVEAAARTFPARDSLRLAALLESMLVDQGERERSVNVGLETARRLTWDYCARATAGVYREVLE
ncbi:MAG TPA: glycosyltransferase family 1 protein [Candidatus Cybelea sp.]|jgi:glycosyltransferase involved in cell wall biosynthesis|nr:glycosyltransferase family 1 protein [Candidatus Cybelea sp.]